MRLRLSFLRALCLLVVLGTFIGSGLVTAAGGGWSAAAWAQDATQSSGASASGAATAAPAAPDYKAWDKIATQAEKDVAAGKLSDRALNDLRNRIADWRGKFQDAENVNKQPIDSLQTQIQALGPAPKDGSTEAPEIAKRRKELEDQLATLKAPGITADEAYTRANGIISQIDALVRQRQANALMQLSPSPINPANWPAALQLLSQTALSVGEEVSDNWSSDYLRSELRGNLPVILGLLAFAAVLLARGPRWMSRLSDRLQSNASSVRGRQIWALLASLGQIILPMAGVLALMQLLLLTGLLGETGHALVLVLPGMGLMIFTAYWLGGQIFPREQTARAVFQLSPERQAEGRIHVASLGILLAFDILRRMLVDHLKADETASGVLAFPILVLVAIVLFRMGQLFRLHVKSSRVEGEPESYRDRLIGLLASLLQLMAVIAPVLGAIGYIAAASAVVLPATMSLALIGLLVIVQRLVEDVYRWAMGSSSPEEDGVIPVLVGFALTLLSLPLFALIWGARVADLGELWNNFSQGFSIGSTHISPASFLTFLVLFAIGYSVTRAVQGALKATLLPKTKLDLGGQNALVAGTGYIGIFASALIAITAAGIDLSSLAIVASALTVGIGFGLQNIVSNFVSGIILMVERPVSEGDWIDVGGVQGTVRSISVRSTRIETFDRADVIVPNSNLITGVVTNMTKFSRIGRLILPVGVAYGTDTRRVDKILREIAGAHPMVVLNPPPNVVFAGFGADSLDFEIRVILRDVNFILDVKTELNHQVAERFAAEGIEIPFAQRDIWLRNPEVLRDVGRGSPVPPPEAAAAGGASTAMLHPEAEKAPETARDASSDSGDGDSGSGPSAQP